MVFCGASERAKKMFPFEDYRKAIEDESATRNGGAEARVVRAERDEASGNWVLQIEPLGKCAGAELEDGTVSQASENGETAFSGEIVSYDEDSRLLAVKAGATGWPTVSQNVTLRPPDYLKKLREFAAEIAADPAGNAPLAERFMGLRDTLLAPSAGPADAGPAAAWLRPSQRQAAANAFGRDFSFVWGPPGTGKSYTLGHIAAELVARGQRVLVLANTNAAADVTTLAIDDAFRRAGRPLAPGELVRHARTLTQREEYAKRPHLLAYTKLLERLAQERRELEKKLKDAVRKLGKLPQGGEAHTQAAFAAAALAGEVRALDERRKAEVAEMLSGAKAVCASVTCAIYNGFQRGRFDAVLVDEASLIPQAVWPCLLHGSGRRRYVVAGDPMQLAPVTARSADLATRSWFDNNVYAYLGMTEYRSIERFIRAGSVALLTEQTRMRKGICEAVSRMFYNGLVTGDRANPRIEWPSAAGLPKGDIALVDPGACGEAHGIGRVPSGFCRNTNSASANAVLDLVGKIERHAPADRDVTVEIITPFRNLASRIYGARLRGRDRRGRVTVTWSTIHCCQGSEADVVILDLVNPGSWFLNNEEASHLWCVACSRAKEQLLVVGDRPAVLAGRYSGRLLEKARANAEA